MALPEQPSASGRLRIRVATPADGQAIQRLNARLKEGGVRYRLPLVGAVPGEFRESADGFPVYRELLIAEDGREVRAGLLLYRAGIWVAGAERAFCWIQLPVSEGLVDHRHALAFVMLMKSVLTREPLLMSLGIGSLDESYARLLAGLGWQHGAVPFVFHAVRAREMLRCMPRLRGRNWLRMGGQVLGLFGLDRAMDSLAGVTRRRNRALLRGCTVERERCFGSWTDEVYRAARQDYGAAVRRDAATLNVRYAPSDPRYIRLRVRRTATGEELGWILVIHGRLRQSQYFGELHVGTVVDGFGRRAEVTRLMQAAADHLADAGAELILANWSDEAWLRAARACGFLPGPSNYFLFVSPKGNALLEPACPLSRIHVTRGDNDGPGHLLPPVEPAHPIRATT
jgi:hypothetical protein